MRSVCNQQQKQGVCSLLISAEFTGKEKKAVSPKFSLPMHVQDFAPSL